MILKTEIINQFFKQITQQLKNSQYKLTALALPGNYTYLKVAEKTNLRKVSTEQNHGVISHRDVMHI